MKTTPELIEELKEHMTKYMPEYYKPGLTAIFDDIIANDAKQREELDKPDRISLFSNYRF